MNSDTYANYTDTRLKEMHGYWMSICRAAKNPAQRSRAEAGAAAAATEIRKRAELKRS
jgi:hypothetical protein